MYSDKICYWMYNVVFFVLLLITPWFWRIVKINVWIALFVLLAFLAVLYSRKFSKLGFFSVFFMIILLVFQLKTTRKTDFFYLDNDQQRVQQVRLSEYPPIKIDLGGKTIWLPVGYWLEGRPESIAFYRAKQNFFELVDSNLYFFANHPRERVGVEEFEKLPYIFLPFFIAGLLVQANKKNWWHYLCFLILPVLILTFWGNVSALGPFLLFPFLIISVFDGFCFLILKRRDGSRKK